MTHTAIVTGAGQGFGLALTTALARRGVRVVGCARDGTRLRAALAGLPGVTALPGDITDARFRAALVQTAGPDLDLLVHNAGELGPSPLPRLADYPLDPLRQVLETGVVAPLALTRLALPALRASGGTVVTLSSDAAVEAYEGWGGYGAAKAASDQVTAVLGVEEPDLAVYAFDPGDMRTAMHQRAFPGEDISDRPEPASVVPALLRLLDSRPPSGRYTAAGLAEAGLTGAVPAEAGLTGAVPTEAERSGAVPTEVERSGPGLADAEATGARRADKAVSA